MVKGFTRAEKLLKSKYAELDAAEQEHKKRRAEEKKLKAEGTMQLIKQRVSEAAQRNMLPSLPAVAASPVLASPSLALSDDGAGALPLDATHQTSAAGSTATAIPAAATISTKKLPAKFARQLQQHQQQNAMLPPPPPPDAPPQARKRDRELDADADHVQQDADHYTYQG